MTRKKKTKKIDKRVEKEIETTITYFCPTRGKVTEVVKGVRIRPAKKNNEGVDMTDAVESEATSQ
jgi:ferredoxin-thioredoxin reductase catalytic subunit